MRFYEKRQNFKNDKMETLFNIYTEGNNFCTLLYIAMRCQPNRPVFESHSGNAFCSLYLPLTLNF